MAIYTIYSSIYMIYLSIYTIYSVDISDIFVDKSNIFVIYLIYLSIYPIYSSIDISDIFVDISGIFVDIFDILLIYHHISPIFWQPSSATLCVASDFFVDLSVPNWYIANISTIFPIFFSIFLLFNNQCSISFWGHLISDILAKYRI